MQNKTTPDDDWLSKILVKAGVQKGFHRITGNSNYVNTLSESDTLTEAHTAINAKITELLVAERVQTLVNIWTRYEYEVMKRDLSSDKMPKGYRKMTDKELLSTVISQLQASQPINAKQKEME